MTSLLTHDLAFKVEPEKCPHHRMYTVGPSEPLTMRLPQGKSAVITVVTVLFAAVCAVVPAQQLVPGGRPEPHQRRHLDDVDDEPVDQCRGQGERGNVPAGRLPAGRQQQQHVDGAERHVGTAVRRAAAQRRRGAVRVPGGWRRRRRRRGQAPRW